MAVRVVSAPWVLTGVAAPSATPTSTPPATNTRATAQGRKDPSLRPGVFARAPVPIANPDAFVLSDAAVALDGDHIVSLGPRAEVESRFGRGEHLDAVLLPALVNAHTHLELSHLRARVPGGEGLVPWIRHFLAARAADPRPGPALDAAIAELEGAGVAAVGEVTNTLATLPHLARAGLSGTAFHEVFGLSEARIGAALAEARALRAAAPSPGPGLSVVTAPHAVYSTQPRVVAELLRAGASSIHLAEDPAERRFCSEGAGPLAQLVQPLGAAEVAPRGRSAVACAAPHLSPRSLAVHLVDLDEEDVAELARSGATAVLCPRSNLHIGGRLPDLPRLLAAGVPLAVGTDSLASSPSLSPLLELAALRRAFPEVAPGDLLALAWNGRAVGAPSVGRIAFGHAPGLLAAPLAGAAPDDPAAWLLDAFARAGRPFSWIARHRPEAV
jgi:cytosine/adenosine deaminase-related metal-dependent hydrolase